MASKEFPTRCESCDVNFRDQESYNQHVETEDHLAQMVKIMNLSHSPEDTESDLSDSGVENIMCNICIKSFSGYIPYKQHLQSGQHIKQINKQKLTTKLEEDAKKRRESGNGAATGNAPILPTPFASCLDCSKQFSGPESYKQHLKSKKHGKKLAEIRFMQNVKADKSLEGMMTFPSIRADSIPPDNKAQNTPEQSREEQILADLRKTMANKTTDEVGDETKSAFTCIECKKVFTGVANYTQHMISQVHQKKLKQIQLLQLLNEQSLTGADDVVEKKSTHSMNVPDDCPKRIRFLDNVIGCELCHMSFTGPESSIAHLKSRGHLKKMSACKYQAEMRNPTFKEKMKTGSLLSATGTAEIKKELPETAIESSSPSNDSAIGEDKPIEVSVIDHKPLRQNSKDNSGLKENLEGDMHARAKPKKESDIKKIIKVVKEMYSE